DVLLHDIVRAVVLADVVRVDYLWMAKPCGGLRFLVEALHELVVRCELWAQHFDRDLTPQQKVVTPMHDRHAAFADYRIDPVPIIVDHARNRPFDKARAAAWARLMLGADLYGQPSLVG